MVSVESTVFGVGSAIGYYYSPEGQQAPRPFIINDSTFLDCDQPLFVEADDSSAGGWTLTNNQCIGPLKPSVAVCSGPNACDVANNTGCAGFSGG